MMSKLLLHLYLHGVFEVISWNDVESPRYLLEKKKKKKKKKKKQPSNDGTRLVDSISFASSLL